MIFYRWNVEFLHAISTAARMNCGVQTHHRTHGDFSSIKTHKAIIIWLELTFNAFFAHYIDPSNCAKYPVSFSSTNVCQVSK